MTNIVKKNNMLELKKHVNTIHCSNELSLLARKMFNALLFHAYHELPHKSCFTISTKDLCRLIGFNSNDTKMLRNTLLTLVSTIIEWNVVGNKKTENQDIWQASTILASAQLSNGLCTYEYSTVMRKQLFKPEMYGKIDVNIISKFKSSYGLALYENCIRYQALLQTPWLSVPIFRKLMGVSEEKYTEFKELKRRVINVAVKEVNMLSTIEIEPIFKYLGRKVEAIKFQISEKANIKPEFIAKISETFETELSDCLKETFHLSPELVSEILLQYEPEYIKEKISLILESKSYKAGIIESLSGYLISAIKNNHQKNVSSQNRLMQKKQEHFQNEERIRQQELKEKQLQKQYLDYKSQYMQQVIGNIDEIEYEQIKVKFIEQIVKQNNTLQTWYKKYDGIKGAALKSFFNNYMLDMHPEKFDLLLSFDNFVLTLTNKHVLET